MNADEGLKQREQISALVDGQLGGLELAAAVELTVADEDARSCWHVYHLVGDVLRSGELGVFGRDRDFLARVNTRLLAEPVAPRIVTTTPVDPESIADNDQQALGNSQDDQKFTLAANDPSFRWKLVAGFASLAAVAAISWSAIGTLESVPGGARLAQSSAMPAVAVSPVLLADAASVLPASQVVIRDPRLDELMAAHRQFGGNSALQNPSGFLRNATFEGAAR
jgi:sigma-E factor negative regulatory protein RseA